MRRLLCVVALVVCAAGVPVAAYAGVGDTDRVRCHYEDERGNVLGLADVDLDDDEGSEQSLADVEVLPLDRDRRRVCERG